MTQFVRLPPRRPWLPDYLRSRVPSLTLASRYCELDPEGRDSPSLVAAALSAHWLDLAARERTTSLGDAELGDLIEIYNLAEELAAHPDSAIREIIVTELIENLDIDPATAAMIRSRLQPVSAALFDEMLG